MLFFCTLSLQIRFDVIKIPKQNNIKQVPQSERYSSSMEMHLIDNYLNNSAKYQSSPFVWCYLLPLIHIFSLISNILCIMVFSSNVFIKKPIAIYFICLLLSDSMCLFIGYIDIINREIYPTIEPSWLCLLLTKNLERLKDYLYAFTERLCLE